MELLSLRQVLPLLTLFLCSERVLPGRHRERNQEPGKGLRTLQVDKHGNPISFRKRGEIRKRQKEIQSQA